MAPRACCGYDRTGTEEPFMLTIDIGSGLLSSRNPDVTFADRPYVYAVRGRRGDGPDTTCGLSNRSVGTAGSERAGDDELVIRGSFAGLGLELEQRFRRIGAGLEETITLRHPGVGTVVLTDIGIGFAVALSSRPEWQLCAVPFLVQLDGTRHEYLATDLVAGSFHNAAYRDPTRPEPPLAEAGRLRSEAWAWWPAARPGAACGLVVAKYNNASIEMSVAAPLDIGGEPVLRFGGVGTSLYGEPTDLHMVPAGGEVAFGTTAYLPAVGRVERGFEAYREFLEARGHGHPVDYDPPVTWNELYDVGWYHSDADELAKHYTKAALLREAAKAQECGCELLYLDPGWEVAEGTTLWDEDRLGAAGELAATLRSEFGLGLGFRTILRCYRDHWAHRHLVLHGDRPKAPVAYGPQQLWEPCLCSDSFREEKIERIRRIVDAGVTFLMVDEMDWRGPCSDPDHGHQVPSTAVDHARAVYDLCRSLRRDHPDLRIECHDPIWPWLVSIYVPTYFRQGFGERGDYDENWGFEYMWNCINDLRTGKALALYYYNLGCSSPLYLHITMAADNDNCLFFWWAASTVRHLGIGGKYGHETVNPGDLPDYDPDARFAAYRREMATYRELKPYFVRGTFHGLDECAHLHTLRGRVGGALVLFNLAASLRRVVASIPGELIGCSARPAVTGAEANWNDGVLSVSAELAPMSPAIVRIGEAATATAGASEP